MNITNNLQTAMRTAAAFISGPEGRSQLLKITAIASSILISIGLIRYMHTPKTINGKQELEKTINVSQEVTFKIWDLLQEILTGKEHPEITRYPSSKNLVFSIASIPGLIFKTPLPKFREQVYRLSDERFANMVKAQEVCLANQLNLLMIPHARQFYVNGVPFIAEQFINIHNESTQKELYQTLPGLDETARQLATFIAKTGFSDVECRNIPIIDDTTEFQGPRRVALIDLEEMHGAQDGIFGNKALQRTGLLRCLPDKLRDIAQAEAYRCGISCASISANIQAARTKEMETNQELQEFYERTGIANNPRKLIQVYDLDSLGLDLEEEKNINQLYLKDELKITPPIITLRDAVKHVIEYINDAIIHAPENDSTTKKRKILLPTNWDDHTGEISKYFKHYSLAPGLCDESWLERIVNALVEKGYLFQLITISSRGYNIQA